MRCISFPSAVMDRVRCLLQRTTGAAVGKTEQVKVEPGNRVLRPPTPGSHRRPSPRTQAAARRWGSDSGVSQSPGYQVLYQPCSSYPEDLLRIHLASSTCRPFLVKSCKTPATETQVYEREIFPDCEVPTLLQSVLDVSAKASFSGTACTVARWKYHQPGTDPAPHKLSLPCN